VALAQEIHGLYQPINSSQVTNLDKIITPLNRGVAKYATLGGIQYALPFTWGVTGIIVNTAKVNEPITSYRQLCDSKYAGYITYRSSYPAFIIMAYGQGHDLYAAANDISEWRKIMEDTLDYMLECDSNVVTYWSTRQESIDLIRSEQAYLAEGWDGTGWLLNETNPDIKFIVPEEGGLGWIDTLAIPAQADNLEAAYVWINYMYEPQNAGKLAESSGYISAVAEAINYLPEDRAARISESLPPEAIDNINWSPSLLPEFDELNTEMADKFQRAVSENR
jgi:spermidine/putrescine transport system substrate-binding protein